ncbi:Protein of unknown function [Propionibacterium freudenreichii]|nr:Protein of unknown function [Propionibacterium freudenreichii]CEH08667.1 Protein of unknown function [Propionibacterium freudenreichii]CEI47515.1 Protein of unknown function [Propionibacterium freudenreichii]CEI49985.1 Protein of unknown function [Propionibacterium freudenreichii]
MARACHEFSCIELMQD